ncbi:MAG: hypothetical protein HOV67_34680 [Kribbellaceae bacterium]|nr:hypothetical protein [Kribbellaceae bacterium]
MRIALRLLALLAGLLTLPALVIAVGPGLGLTTLECVLAAVASAPLSAVIPLDRPRLVRTGPPGGCRGAGVMTGAEHYREAERLIERQNVIPSKFDETNPAAALMLAEATAHAILALAAAVVTNDRLEGVPVDQLAEWLPVLRGQTEAVRRG